MSKNKRKKLYIRAFLFGLITVVSFFFMLQNIFAIKKFMSSNLGQVIVKSATENKNMESTSTIDIAAQSPSMASYYLPILMYHHIALKRPQDSYYVSSEILDAQMKWLRDNNYTVISMDRYYSFLSGKTTLPPNPVIITFDDGDSDHYTNAFPIIKKYGYTATFFVRLDLVDTSTGISSVAIKKMSDAGMTIGSHTIDHTNLAQADESRADYELRESKTRLEVITGKPVLYFAYPGGSYSKLTPNLVQAAGYKLAFTTEHRVMHSRKDSQYLIPRIHIDDEMPSFEDWIVGKNLQ